jgi:type II secretory ATPase GspE/PulE/Tfp pilus assembly ATPase PilB-like protein
VIAQRLIRVLCSECKTEEKITEETRKNLYNFPKDCESYFLPKGCNRCNYTGFYGRSGIYEIITINETIRHMIQTKASIPEIHGEAIRSGTISLRRSGFNKVKNGITSLDEVLRVTAETG